MSVEASISYTSASNANLSVPTGQATAANSFPAVLTSDQADIWTYHHLAAAGTATIKSSAGILGNIIVNKSIAASVITVLDGTAVVGAGTIAVITSPAVLLHNQFESAYHASFTAGLIVITTGLDDITVTYK